MKLILDSIRSYIFQRKNLHKILGNLRWLFIDKIFRMGAGLLIMLWIARYLGPEQFGVLNFAIAFVALFSVIAGLGLQTIVIRDILLDPSDQHEIVGTALVLQFIGGLVAYGLLILGILWLRPEDPLISSAVAILGSIFLFKSSEVAIYWFESQLLSRYVVFIQIACFVFFAAVKTILILRNMEFVYLIWAIVAEAQLAALLILFLFGKIGLRLNKLKASYFHAKKMLSDSWPELLSGIAVLMYMRIDQIMLGEIDGDKSVGIYSAALRLSEIWYFVPVTIAASVFPAIIRAKEYSEELYYKRMQQLFDLMVLLSLCLALPMTFMASDIVIVAFGREYEAAGEVLASHIWSSIFAFLGVASGKWLLAENRQILALQRTALGLLMNVVLNIFLIPSYGAVGAAWATLISYALAGMFADAIQADTRIIFFMKLRSFSILSAASRVYKFNK